MKNTPAASKRHAFVTWMLVGIPVLFLLASPLHFIYDWTGKSLIVGFLAPVSESPWEHLKLVFWPILVWWLVGYLTIGRKARYPLGKAAVSCAVTEIVALLIVLSFFYTYTGALGVESLIVDIASLLLALFAAILLAVHIVTRRSPGRLSACIAILLILGLMAVFVYFTVSAPHLPLFLDTNTGTYGIP